MEKTKVQEVKEYILRAVKKGQIKDGERLPSCRDLAERLSMNKITVNKAYIELENEHRVFSVRRGGFYWIKKDETSVSASGRIIDFTSVQPESRLIPLREFTHVINQAADYYKNWTVKSSQKKLTLSNDFMVSL